MKTWTVDIEWALDDTEVEAETEEEAIAEVIGLVKRGDIDRSIIFDYPTHTSARER